MAPQRPYNVREHARMRLARRIISHNVKLTCLQCKDLPATKQAGVEFFGRVANAITAAKGDIETPPINISATIDPHAGPTVKLWVDAAEPLYTLWEDASPNAYA